MRDLDPITSNRMLYIEQTFIDIAKQYGYDMIRFPILESTELFKKSIGIETDIVGQEMYNFDDKSDSNISLRPEGTAGCLRSCLASGLIQRNKQKLFYLGSMFRRERPQQGRFREFTHFGVETFGYPSGLIDVELIDMTHRVWKKLKLQNIKLHINYLGSPESRKLYHETLSTYWKENMSKLSESEQKRAESNPLRLLDSKNPDIAELIKNAPTIVNSLNSDEKLNYQAIKNQLTSLNIAFIESHKLVRGLDYYSDFIFEWISDDLGAQSTICGGGRYDTLVESMGADVPATGFAAGIDRIELLLPKQTSQQNQVFICAADDSYIHDFLPFLSKAREYNIKIELDPVTGKIKNKIKSATDNGFGYIVILYPENQLKIVNTKHDESKQLSFADFVHWCNNLNKEQL